jgi:hypothetical protein
MFARHGAPAERGIFLTEGYKHLAALRPVTEATHYYPTTYLCNLWILLFSCCNIQSHLSSTSLERRL